MWGPLGSVVGERWWEVLKNGKGREKGEIQTNLKIKQSQREAKKRKNRNGRFRHRGD